MNIPLKAKKENELYIYQSTSGHRSTRHIINDDELTRFMKSNMNYPETLMGTNTNMYLSLAAFLVAQKEKYIIIRHSPESDLLFKSKNDFLTCWNYVVLADDFNGMGLDKGFVKSEVPYAAYKTNSPYNAEKVSEDTLEEEYSNVTIFGLNLDSKERIMAFYQSDEIDRLENFLESDEIFINIVCGKQYGYFNSFIAKSKTDLQEIFDEFKNTTDAET